MKVSNVRVYGLEESIIASRYPFRVEIPTEEEFDEHRHAIIYQGSNCTVGMSTEFDVEKVMNRASNLAGARGGSGHDCFLKGIIVQYDLTAPEYFWRQFDRYHFHDYISSQSKMHCILKFDLGSMCNEYVDQRVIDIVNEYITIYNGMVEDKLPKNELSEVFHKIISNCPMGLELTARVTDNYLQLKSKYRQRKGHKLENWKYYRDWIETLPMAEELIIGRD